MKYLMHKLNFLKLSKSLNTIYNLFKIENKKLNLNLDNMLTN